MLKENGYQESIISKIFKRVTNNQGLSQSQLQKQATDIQEEEIRMSIHLACVEGTSEKLQRILKSYKVRSTFYIESSLRKLLCKPKDQVAKEDEDNIVYEIDCSNCEVFYFGESTRFLKSGSDEQNLSVRNCDCEKSKMRDTVGKQITTLAWVRRKFLIGKAGKFIGRLKKLYIL